MTTLTDANSSIETAQFLALGEVASANLSNSADVDYFAVTVNEPSLIRLFFNTERLDVVSRWQFSILDGNLNYLAAPLALTVKPVTLFETAVAASKEIKVAGLAAKPADGTQLTFVSNTGKSEIYTILDSAIDGSNWKITLNQALLEGYGSGSELVFSPGFLETGSNGQIEAYASTAGTYYFKIESSTWSSDQYKLGYEVVGLKEREGNGSFAAAQEAKNHLEANLAYTGTLDKSTDADYYYFTTKSGVDFDINLKSVNGTQSNPTLKLEVFDENGASLYAPVDVGDIGTISISKNVYQTSKTFVVKVSVGTNYLANPYLLEVRGDSLEVNHAPLITSGSYTTSGWDGDNESSNVPLAIEQNKSVLLSDLFKVSDSDGDAVKSYYVGVSGTSGQIIGGSETYAESLIDNVGYRYKILTHDEFLSAKFSSGTLGVQDLFIQALDNSGAADGTAMSSVLYQTIKTIKEGYAFDVAAPGTPKTNDAPLVEEGDSGHVTLTLRAPSGVTGPLANPVDVYLDVLSGRLATTQSMLTFKNYGETQSFSIQAKQDGLKTNYQAEIGFRVVSKDQNFDGLFVDHQTINVQNASNSITTGSLEIVGTPKVGERLTIKDTIEDPDGLGTKSYKWFEVTGDVRKEISGANRPYLDLTTAQSGKKIEVEVSYTDALGNRETPKSSSTTFVNSPTAGTLAISGVLAQGKVLSVIDTLTDDNGINFGTKAYQWKAANVNIAGATGSSYTLGASDSNKAITVTATYTDLLGNIETAASAPTASVKANSLPTGTLSIKGVVKQGQTLTAVVNKLKDADGLGTISYQWYADGQSINGASKSTYKLTQAEVSKNISVVASYYDKKGVPESVSSGSTSKVVNVNDLPQGTVSINGAALQYQTLTVASILADADGMGSVSYQWKANGVSIKNATLSTYTLGQGDVGKRITVTASYIDGFGKQESKTSAATAKVVNVNDAPQILNALPNQSLTEGKAFSFSMPSKAFSDLDGEALSYTATYNGGALPAWIKFTKNKFTGTPSFVAGDNQSYAITVTAKDKAGLAASNTFELKVTEQSNVVGTTRNDNLVTNEGEDKISGLTGNDTISAGNGKDLINGGKGADTLTGGKDSDTFVFTAGDSGQGVGAIDKITDFEKGVSGIGDVIDYSSFLSIGGSYASPSATKASINQTTGIASFDLGSGTTLADALRDIAGSFTNGGDAAGEFALFQINKIGDYHIFISDGRAGVTASDVVVQLVGVASVNTIDLTGGNLSILS